MHISFVYLLDSVWREYMYIYLGSYFVVHSTYFLLFVVRMSAACCYQNRRSLACLPSP